MSPESRAKKKEKRKEKIKKCNHFLSISLWQENIKKKITKLISLAPQINTRESSELLEKCTKIWPGIYKLRNGFKIYEKILNLRLSHNRNANKNYNEVTFYFLKKESLIKTVPRWVQETIRQYNASFRIKSWYMLWPVNTSKFLSYI